MTKFFLGESKFSFFHTVSYSHEIFLTVDFQGFLEGSRKIWPKVLWILLNRRIFRFSIFLQILPPPLLIFRLFLIFSSEYSLHRIYVKGPIGLKVFWTPKSGCQKAALRNWVQIWSSITVIRKLLLLQNVLPFRSSVKWIFCQILSPS